MEGVAIHLVFSVPQVRWGRRDPRAVHQLLGAPGGQVEPFVAVRHGGQDRGQAPGVGNVGQMNLHRSVRQCRVVGQTIDRVDVEQRIVCPGAAGVELGRREPEPDFNLALGGKTVPAVQFRLLQGRPSAVRFLRHAADVLAEVPALVASRSPDGQLDVVGAGGKGGGDEQLMPSIALDAVPDGAHSQKRSSMGRPVHPLGRGKPIKADRVGAMSRISVRAMPVRPSGTPGPMMRNGTWVS